MTTPVPQQEGLFQRTVGGLVRHETLSNLIFVSILLLGLLAWSQIRVQFFPDVVLEKIRVAIVWNGASAEEIDRAVIAVIEPVVREVEGVTETETDAVLGLGTLIIAFETGTRMDLATERVRDAINRLSDVLPQELEAPDIQAGIWRDEVAEVVLFGDLSADQLAYYSDRIIADLYKAGATRADVLGISANSYRVYVPQEQLYRHGLSLQQIAAKIGAGARELPAGTLNGVVQLSLGTALRSVAELRQVVLRNTDGEAPLRLGDIAQIEPVPPVENGVVRYKGLPAVYIPVQRGAGEDALIIESAVEDVLEQFVSTAPPGVQTEIIRSRTALITDQIGQLGSSALLGAALVLLVLYLTLSPQIAFWVMASIPISLFTCVILLALTGHTINMLSLLAMSICIGMIVDDSIIIAENADYRVHKLGEAPAVASVRAAADMLPLIMAATLTTIFAFSVIAVISGEFGAFVRDIPFTVAAVMLGSTIDCFLILPKHLSHALKPDGTGRNTRLSPGMTLAGAMIAGGLLVYLGAGMDVQVDGPLVPIDGRFGFLPFLSVDFEWAAWLWLGIGAAVGAALWLLWNIRHRFAALHVSAPRFWVNDKLDTLAETFLRPVLGWALKLRYLVLVLLIAALAGSFWLIRSGVVDWQFFRSPESTTLYLHVTMEDGTTATETLATVETIEQRLGSVLLDLSNELGRTLDRNRVAIAGGRFGAPLEHDLLLEQRLLGSVAVQFNPFQAGDPSVGTISKRIETELANLPGVARIDFRSADLSPAGAGVAITLFADDPTRLKTAIDALSDQIRAIPVVFELRDTIPATESFGQIELLPRAVYLGFTEADIRLALQSRLDGVEAFSFSEDGRQGSVRVHLPKGELNAAFLEGMRIQAADGTLVPLEDLVRISQQPGLGVIRRSNGELSASVIGRLDASNPRATEAALRDIRSQILPEITTRYGVTSEEVGLARQERDFVSEAIRGGLLCLIGIYATLVLALRSWSRPLIILTAIPFSLIGVVFGHFVWSLPFSMFSILGVFGLAGVVINDAIVLMDAIRKQDPALPMRLRAVEAATMRFRAIVLTTVTTLLGLMPILYTQNLQADFLSPIVITLFYGLGFGMVTVLLLVPLLAAMLDDIQRVIAGLWRRMLPAST